MIKTCTKKKFEHSCSLHWNLTWIPETKQYYFILDNTVNCVMNKTLLTSWNKDSSVGLMNYTMIWEVAAKDFIPFKLHWIFGGTPKTRGYYFIADKLWCNKINRVMNKRPLNYWDKVWSSSNELYSNLTRMLQKFWFNSVSTEI